ncbi:MAG: hypothetical protein IPG68_02400 [Micrococcales bacterium]|nr:hypothetical protein [Micrococcales bacterium]
MKALALIAAPAIVLATPAAASAMTVDVSPRKGLPSSGSVTVKVSGLPKKAGVYVRLCKKPAKGARPTASQCLNTGGQYAGVWVLGKYPYGPRPSASNIAKPGRTFRLPVRSSFGSVNCKTTKCAIVVRRDHRAGGDRSYDRAIRVRFR